MFQLLLKSLLDVKDILNSLRQKETLFAQAGDTKSFIDFQITIQKFPTEIILIDSNSLLFIFPFTDKMWCWHFS